MATLVWVMIGIALWHFAIFVPDHFWSGIVGAFVGAVLGALLIGFLVHGFTVPGTHNGPRLPNRPLASRDFHNIIGGPDPSARC